MSEDSHAGFEWDDDDDAFLAAWAEVDRQALEVLDQALGDTMAEDPPDELGVHARQLRADVERGAWPCAYFRNACGWQRGVPESDDLFVWLTAAAAVISPTHDPEGDIEELSSIGSLQHAEWLAAVLGLVRRGVGSQFDEATWFADLGHLPEIDADLSEEDPESYALAVEVLAPLWQALGALDEERRLTSTGRWGLPQALRVVWGAND